MSEEQDNTELNAKIEEIISTLNSATLFSPEWMAQVLTSINPIDSEAADFSEVKLFRIENFLNEEECDFWTKTAKPHVIPSKIFGDQENYRVSKSCVLNSIQEEEVMLESLKLDVKISNALNLHPSYGEPTEFETFQSGDFFKIHTDYFDVNTFESQQIAIHQGQRTWTFVIYLNETEVGGETIFPALKSVKIKPQKGMAVAWNNLADDARVNEFTAHEEAAVIKGSKNVLTKCFRDRILMV